MTRLKPVDQATASGATKEALDKIQAKMGRVPNIFALMGNSPAAVNAYLAMSEALSHGALDAHMRERIAISAAEIHHCEYCLSAHTAIAKSVGLSDDEQVKARQSQSGDAKADVGLTFVRNILLRKADVQDSDIADLHAAGYTDGEIAELIANTALNVFTNYFNLIAKTENDFPKVPLLFPA
ncbi:MAG: carboxymuconolactone decarboxylase family protein [Candidatus Obscuribacterales bacterium]|nr:carboxymuconolactone decarboxylase family protein [Cyanobacteria bacterium SZAS LIN-5]